MKLVQIQIKSGYPFDVFGRTREDCINLLIRVKVIDHSLLGLLLIPDKVVFLRRGLLRTWLLAD